MSAMSTQRRKNSEFFNIQAQKRLAEIVRRKEREEAKKERDKQELELATALQQAADLDHE